MSLAKRFRTWLKQFPKEPADRMALAVAAVDAYAACQPKNRLTPEHLAPVVRAAQSPHKLVYETGCSLLVDLAVAMPYEAARAAQQCILDMARHKNATTRLHAVQYLQRDLPYKLRVEVVNLALQDRSAKVRKFGVVRALSFDFKCVLPRLEEMLRTEPDKRVREELTFCLPLLRDGFLVRPNEHSEGYVVTVHKRNGTIISSIIPTENYSKEFVSRTIAQLRKVP